MPANPEVFGSGTTPVKGDTQRTLLVKLVNATVTGGGGGVVSGNYAGGQPNFTPASGTGNAIDTSNGRIWWYYSGAWH